MGKGETGDVAQELGVLTALAGDQGLFPSTHAGQLTAPGNPTPSFGLCPYSCASTCTCLHTQTLTNTHTHNLKINLKNFKPCKIEGVLNKVLLHQRMTEKTEML